MSAAPENAGPAAVAGASPSAMDGLFARALPATPRADAADHSAHCAPEGRVPTPGPLPRLLSGGSGGSGGEPPSKQHGGASVWLLARSHLALAGPFLVPVSVGVYALYMLLLFRADYASACSVLGLAIYGACSFSCLHARVPDPAELGAVARPSLFDPLTALARSRVGVFVLINIVALTCYLYVAFLQHALQQQAIGGRAAGDAGAAAGTALQPEPTAPAPLGGGARGIGGVGPGGRLPLFLVFTSRGGLALLAGLGYSLLFSCYKALNAHVFEGRLRAREFASVSERAASYVAAKVVLLAVLSPANLTEGAMWVSWFSLLGFLRVVARLVRLRLADCAERPDGRRRVRRLAALAHVLIGSALFWIAVAVLFCVTAGAGARTLALLTSECGLLALDALACIGHHRALRCREWEAGRELRHRVDVAHELLTGLGVIGQHAHTWLINNSWVLHGPWLLDRVVINGTMLDVFLVMSVYAEATALAHRVREHASFVKRTLELQKCPVASAEELSSYDDHCAVCLELLLPPGASAAAAPSSSARTSASANSGGSAIAGAGAGSGCGIGAVGGGGGGGGGGSRSVGSGPQDDRCWMPSCCARRLACGHIFHSVCLSAWLEQHRTCPTCRAPTSRPGGSTSQQQLDQPDIRLRRPPSDPLALADVAGAQPSADELDSSLARCALRMLRPAPPPTAGHTFGVLDEALRTH